MKKYTIISLFVIAIISSYFVIHVNANPQGVKHELMNVRFEPIFKRMIISTSDGKDEDIKLSDRNFSLGLIKLKELEDQGWVIKSFTNNSTGGFYDYLLER